MMCFPKLKPKLSILSFHQPFSAQSAFYRSLSRKISPPISHVRDLSRSTRAGFCLSSYMDDVMDDVIPVVAMLKGRGLRAPADLSLTPVVRELAAAEDMALRALAVLFSREMPGNERTGLVGEATLVTQGGGNSLQNIEHSCLNSELEIKSYFFRQRLINIQYFYLILLQNIHPCTEENNNRGN